MTKIIGHRGAAGLALENTPDSLRAALKQKLDAIEFDVHLTRDGRLVVLHDRHTARVAKENVLVHEKTLAELQAIELNNGQRIPTLEQVLGFLGKKPLIIELKDTGSVSELLRVLDLTPEVSVSIASFKREELEVLRELRPDIPIYVLEHLSPIEIIQTAQRLQARGIGLNKWLMNPLTYRLAERYELELYVYTLNSPLLGKLFTKFYPNVAICTDYPARFIKASGRAKG
jgi:glycerophosphoryl diester phosphodiesterase